MYKDSSELFDSTSELERWKDIFTIYLLRCSTVSDYENPEKSKFSRNITSITVEQLLLSLPNLINNLSWNIIWRTVRVWLLWTKKLQNIICRRIIIVFFPCLPFNQQMLMNLSLIDCQIHDDQAGIHPGEKNNLKEIFSQSLLGCLVIRVY